jgi:hypothetical protein
MDREEIIRTAREAGLRVGTNLSGVVLVGSPAEIGLAHLTIEELERFATLVAAAERENLAAWMIERGYATGHGDTIKDLLKELEWQIAEREREACAKVVEDYCGAWNDEGYALAAAIRARGDK